MLKKYAAVFCLFLAFADLASADAATYDLDIARTKVNVTGAPVEKITVNGSLPAPTLRFAEGEDVVVRVTNHLDDPSSIHWHGLLVPGEMDGVPGLNGFTGIAPGETFTYRFKVRQAGTYWYHAHSGGQEQDGLYGAIVIAPAGQGTVRADRDYVVVLSEFMPEDSRAILANLKMASDYYNAARRTVGDFVGDVRRDGFAAAWANARMWSEMRMTPTDLADVGGYTFLINGRSPDQNWTGIFKPGERIRLRFINASAMSFYDVRIPGLTMEVVQADGRNVEPVTVDEFRFAVAETYDVIVTPQDDQAYTIVAEPIGRSGFALGTLAPRGGMRGDKPEPRPRTLLTMADMGMVHGGGAMAGMDHSAMGHDRGAIADMSGESGWAKAGTPPGHKALTYADLRTADTQKDTRPPGRTITVRLGGNMERYIWAMDGRTSDDARPVKLKYGERVRIRFVNETMMAHPMHLHGMFVQLENGQPPEKRPDKHTVIVPPGQSYSVLLTADEPGEWAFHCHLLYHMASGMMTRVVVATFDPPPPQEKERHSSEPSAGGGDRHAH